MSQNRVLKLLKIALINQWRSSIQADLAQKAGFMTLRATGYGKICFYILAVIFANLSVFFLPEETLEGVSGYFPSSSESPAEIWAVVFLLAAAYGFLIGLLQTLPESHDERQGLLGLPLVETDISWYRLLLVAFNGAGMFFLVLMPLGWLSLNLLHPAPSIVTFAVTPILLLFIYLAGLGAGMILACLLIFITPRTKLGDLPGKVAASAVVVAGLGITVIISKETEALTRLLTQILIHASATAHPAGMASSVALHFSESAPGKAFLSAFALVALTATVIWISQMLLVGALARSDSVPAKHVRHHQRAVRSSRRPEFFRGNPALRAMLVKDFLLFRRESTTILRSAGLLIAFALMLPRLFSATTAPAVAIAMFIPFAIAGTFFLHSIGLERSNILLIKMIVPDLRFLFRMKLAVAMLGTLAVSLLSFLIMVVLAPGLRETAAEVLLRTGLITVGSIIAACTAIGLGALFARFETPGPHPGQGVGPITEMGYWILSLVPTGFLYTIDAYLLREATGFGVVAFLTITGLASVAMIFLLYAFAHRRLLQVE